MAYDEAHHKKSRVVVETPAARREVVETRTAYAAPERRGVSTGVVALVAITAVVLTAIVAWALTRPTTDDVTTTTMNSRVATQPTPITQVVTVPVPQQQPVVVPPATTTTTTQPIIVPAPSTTTTAPSTSTTETARTSGTDDSSIQSSIERKFADDPKVAALGISVTVLDGKVTLMGSVDSRDMKARVERLAKVKGVKSVDNQITVTASSADSTQD